MAENSKISWTHHTFNPWEGCQKVGPGCDHCYAESRNARFGGGTAVNWGPGAPRRRTSASNWAKPVKWNAEAARLGVRYRVFCSSLADVFDNAVPNEWRDDLFKLIEATPHLDWLLLTKRIGNVGNMLPVPFDFDRHYPNVWLGITVVNQGEAYRDIPKLLGIPAARRFLSMEPLLGPVDLRCIPLGGHGHHEFDPIITANVLDRPYFAPEINWVIVGGESGPKARPMHPQWARSLRDQCQSAGVPFHFKQWGEWLPGHHYTDELQAKDADMAQSRFACAQLGDGEFFESEWQIGFVLASETWDEDALYRVGKKAAGRLLDGRTWDEFPVEGGQG